MLPAPQPEHPVPAVQGEDLPSATSLPRLARSIIGRLGAVGVDVDVRPLEDGRVATVRPTPCRTWQARRSHKGIMLTVAAAFVQSDELQQSLTSPWKFDTVSPGVRILAAGIC